MRAEQKVSQYHSSTELDLTGHLQEALWDGGNLLCRFTNLYATSTLIRCSRVESLVCPVWWNIASTDNVLPDSWWYTPTHTQTAVHTEGWAFQQADRQFLHYWGVLTSFLKPLSLTTAAVSFLFSCSPTISSSFVLSHSPPHCPPCMHLLQQCSLLPSFSPHNPSIFFFVFLRRLKPL